MRITGGGRHRGRMTTLTAATPHTHHASDAYRRLSTLLLGAGVIQLAGGATTMALGGEYASRTASTFLSAGWGVGWTLIALALLTMTRTSMAGERTGRHLPFIPFAGAVCYVAAEIWWVWNLTVGGRTAEAIEEDAAVALLPAGALLGAAGMVVTGVAVVRARRWTGWRRFAPLAAGLYPFVAMFGFVIVTGGPNLLAIVGWSLPWIAVGVAAAVEGQATRRRSSMARRRSA
jgi:hypothetical protein